MKCEHTRTNDWILSIHYERLNGSYSKFDDGNPLHILAHFGILIALPGSIIGLLLGHLSYSALIFGVASYAYYLYFQRVEKQWWSNCERWSKEQQKLFRRTFFLTSYGVAEVVLENITESPVLMELRNRQGWSLLHLIAAQGEDLNPGHLEIARKILQSGGDVNAHDMNCFTPLHLIAVNGSNETIPLVRLLLAHGADLNAENALGMTPDMVLLHGSQTLKNLLTYQEDDESLIKADAEDFVIDKSTECIRGQIGHAVGVLRAQAEILGMRSVRWDAATINKALGQPWALGYMFGVMDAFGQIRGIGANARGVALMTIVLLKTFKAETAPEIMRTMLDQQQEPEFLRGRRTGGDEVFQSRNSDTRPSGLQDYLIERLNV